jgi:hypothetical protein
MTTEGIIMTLFTATRTATFSLGALLALGLGGAVAQETYSPELRKLCKDDYSKYCAGVTPGGGAIRDCMVGNIEKLSPQCRAGLEERRKNAAAKPKS